MNYVYTICEDWPMDSMGDRLKRAREKYFKSARQAALKHGWKYSTYGAHENGQNDYFEAEAKAYAKAFKTTPEWLLLGRGDPGKNHNEVAVAGYVGAGAVVVPIDDHAPGAGIEEVELPPGAPPNVVAVVVKGDSMYPRYIGGERLFYTKDGRPPDELIGRECVIKLTDDRMLVKTLRKGSKRGKYTLESLNAPPLEDQAVKWAAPVKWTYRG